MENEEFVIAEGFLPDGTPVLPGARLTDCPRAGGAVCSGAGAGSRQEKRGMNHGSQRVKGHDRRAAVHQ